MVQLWYHYLQCKIILKNVETLKAYRPALTVDCEVMEFTTVDLMNGFDLLCIGHQNPKKLHPKVCSDDKFTVLA